MKITRLFLLISLILVLNVKLFGQDKFVEGYIVTNNNDTIYGMLQDKFPMQLAYTVDKVIFKKDSNITIYKPKDLKQYHKKGSVGYMSIVNDNSQWFGRILIEGNVRLICLEMAYSGTTNIISLKEDDYGKEQIKSINRVVYFLYMHDQDKIKYIKKSNFKEIVKKYLYDNNEIIAKIESKEYKFSDLRQIIKEYNSNKNQVIITPYNP